MMSATPYRVGQPETNWTISKELVPFFIVFAFFNIIDVICTLFMIQHGAVETNPACGYFLDNYGAFGFILYKFFQLLFVIGITQVISWKKPNAGKAVIRLGCTLYFMLMVWDVILLTRV